MSASGRCPHVDVHLNLNVAHARDSNTKYLEITARCKICEAAMTFPCPSMGSSPWHPTINPDGTEIRVPMRADGEEPTGSNVGFSIEHVL